LRSYEGKGTSFTSLKTLYQQLLRVLPFSDRDTQLVVAAASKIREQAEANGAVIGLDIEWEISRAGGSPNPPATIQLAAGRQVVIFHVLHGQRSTPEKLPSSLVALLGDSKLAKTGVGVKGDCTRLREFYGADVRNVVDLPSMASTRKHGVAACPFPRFVDPFV